MEGDEMEMSREELQRWIRENVTQSELISTDVLQKCNLLQSLLERRQKQAARLLKLCECVAACELIVRKQYSLLGWEYRDTDSDDDVDDDDDDEDETGSGYSPPSPCEFGHAEAQAPSSQSTSGSTHLLPKPEKSELYRSFIKLKKKPVVVLTRLPACVISSLRPPAPWNHYSEDETLNKLDSDMVCEPEGDTGDSDFSISTYNTGPNKRRKICQKTEKLAKHPATRRARTRTSAKSNATKTSTPQANRNTNSKSSALKTSTPPANTNVISTCLVSTLCRSSDKVCKTPRSVPQREISVNMKVLARRRAMSWQQGEIMSIIKKEDGKLKYKISIEEKGKILVSSHHIAFDCMAEAEELFVGARVVIRCQAENPQFCSGVLAELPSRENHMRFLVFTDNHKPFYVGLPLLHLVCRPLEDPLDDIPDDTHKNFMKKYIKSWPNPPQTQYKVGQIINAELNGAQQRCKVVEVDSSLIQVVFEKDEQKEWIYRGSFRLENKINMSKHFGLKSERRKSERTKSTAVKGSSKSH